MNARHIFILVAACAAPALLHAEEALPAIATVPQKAPLTRYATLWNPSPFTVKPVVAPTAPLANPFEELVLRGVAPLSNGGYLVTMVNKKNPQEVTRIDTQRGSDFTVVKVERDPSKRLGTVVHLSKGGQTGTVSYDEKIANSIKALPKANPQQPPVPGQPVLQAQVPGQLPAGIRPPRQRVVMPPTPAAGTNQGSIHGHQSAPRPTRR